MPADGPLAGPHGQGLPSLMSLDHTLTSEALGARAIEVLEQLVGFNTTSRDSNLKLISFVEAQLEPLGVVGVRIANEDGAKANLYATLGPMAPGGVALSGHTDVVPVDGQPWSSDPFTLTRRGERLFGRGTCDMKGFIALAMAAAPLFAAPGRLQRPVHLAFSYDEEVGCLGAPSMIRQMAERLPQLSSVIVGEPTNMEAVSGHKGIATFRVRVTGHEAHSSLTHLGVSANMAAIGLMNVLREVAERLEREADPASPFTPKNATLTVGLINGGTAVNILARECVFAFDLRCPPGVEPSTILAPFMAQARELDVELKGRCPDAGIVVEQRSCVPPFAPEPDGAAEVLARRLAGDNGPARVVSYGAEAGQFQQAGFSTIICGPGSIEQAHKADEYVEVAQMQRGAAFMIRLAEALAS